MTETRPNLTSGSEPSGTISAMSWRILPLLGVAYLFAYMDRVNISFAALQMNADLGFSASVYGLGGGLFFLAYALFEVPSNLILTRVGARRWIARIMITWGLLSAATMFVQVPWQFYLVRFLLGAAEAGFLPGIIYYLTHWYPKAVRGRALSVIYLMGAFAGVAIGIVSPILLSLDGMRGLQGWQWLFLIEGLPAALIGVVVLVCLPDAPSSAHWLDAAQKAWLARELANDAAVHGEPDQQGVLAALRHPQVWRLGLFGFLTVGAAITFALSAPQMLQIATTLDVTGIGVVTSTAALLAVVAIWLSGLLSDRKGDRFLIMLGGCVVLCASFAVLAVALQGYPYLAIAAVLATSLAGWAVTFGNISSWPDLLPKHLLAVGGAAINTISQVGAFLMPYAWGATRDATGSFVIGLIGLSLAAAIAFCVALMSRSQARLLRRNLPSAKS